MEIKRLFLFSLFIILFLVGGVKYIDPVNTNQFLIKVINKSGIKEISQLEPRLRFLEKEIIPRLCVFHKQPGDKDEDPTTFLEQLKRKLRGKGDVDVFKVGNPEIGIRMVEYIEQIKKTYEPFEISKRQLQEMIPANSNRHRREKRTVKSLVLEPPFYGMGIPEAWDQGYTGEGVVIAVTDVGVSADIPDLQANLDVTLSQSFVGDQRDFAPDDFPSYPDLNDAQDHGNKCAGLIVGDKNNVECTVGVAYKAKLAALKVFKVELINAWSGTLALDHLDMRKALVHRLDEIDVYSNSWSTKNDDHFTVMRQSLKDVFEHGAVKGRHGKGRIYVFPPGGLADGYSNSPYTITVNGIGREGRDAEFSTDCACVLTTAFGEGHTSSSDRFITTSWNHHNRYCTDAFAGTSPATAITSGIIALALQANPRLTLRDVQYLIIQSSSKDGIQDSGNFVKNAAGRFYHKRYGYGLIDVSKLVASAKLFSGLPKQVIYQGKYTHGITRYTDIGVTWGFDIKCPCNADTKECISTVEQVVVKTSFKTQLENETELILISPSKTKSYLMCSNQSLDAATTRCDIEFLSVHFWGEKAIGAWTVNLRRTTNTPGDVSIQDVSITLYGTIEENSDLYSSCAPKKVKDNPNEQGSSSSAYLDLVVFVVSILSLIFIIKTTYS